MGLGKSYTGFILGPYNSTANGQKTLSTDWARYLKRGGLVDDVTPCHYGTCDIYRMFGDAVELV